MTFSDDGDGGGFGGGDGFDGSCHDAPLIEPLAAAWVDLDLRKSQVDATEPLQAERLRRNGPCPCGSGKKFKQCCIGVVLPTRRSNYLKLVTFFITFLIGLALLARLF